MTSAFPLDRVDQTRLAAVAEQARNARDVPLPAMPALNMAPCSAHEHLGTPQSSCRACGLASRRHQRVAGTWLFFARKGLLADPCGSGKTASAAIALAMVYQAGEMNTRRGGGRVVVVCRPPAVTQWLSELQRFTPSIRSAAALGTPAQRGLRYAEPWDVIIIGHQTFLRDREIIGRLGVKHLVIDDVDPIRHSETATAWALKELAVSCYRVMILSATPLQKRLEEMYDLLTLIDGKKVFGSKTGFMRRYTKRDKVDVYTSNPNLGKPVPGGGGQRDTRKSIKRSVSQTTGYRNLGEFKALLAPMALRRRVEELEDVEMPTVESNNVFLELYAPQRERYKDLQRGVIQLLRDSPKIIDTTSAISKMIYGSQICESLAALDEGDGPNMSVKFDWLLDRLQGDWSGESDEEHGEKVVVFVQYIPGVKALQRRLKNANIDSVTVWGKERGVARDETVDRFRQDPNCRVLIGTTAIEQSLNLQIARHLVNVDQLMNPARMVQLAGRVRRDGSKYSTVYVHNLLTRDTHEERILRMLESEAALSGAVWGEQDPIYAQLTPVQMMHLIAPGDRRNA